MKPTPILFLGDSPHLHTGLARIGRDLACCVAKLPQFRVGYLGRGGHGSSQLPFTQYNFPADDQWGESHIYSVWEDFARDQSGIIFTIWDASRLSWFGNPIGISGTLGNFLRRGKFERWGYFPVDSTGVNGQLTAMSTATIANYTRVLAYGAFGSQIIGRSIGREVDWIPHGMNLDVFTPRDRTAARMSMGMKPHQTVVGCVMANQARKDWGLAFATIARLQIQIPNLVFWAHVDTLLRHWDIRALANDFGLTSSTVVTLSQSMSDTELSYAYSACDITMLPSLGEGFGYPIVESLACGVPVVHGNYAGGVELIPNRDWLVPTTGERLDTPQNCVRPVYSPAHWVETIQRVLAERQPAEYCRHAVEHLDWTKLWPATWRKWFLEGL